MFKNYKKLYTELKIKYACLDDHYMILKKRYSELENYIDDLESKFKNKDIKETKEN